MMGYKLGARSLKRLEGLHPDLVKVVKRAIEISEVDFTVLEGMRTTARQRQLMKAGATRTMNSRHLTGHAVDLGAWVGGAVRWDWPLYHKIAVAVKQAAKDVGVPIEWGGDWRTFKDGPHWQLPWKGYPA
jgi:peptidoglycan L-alanyl-D-glutamate endopeptidase CwlK